MIEMKTINVIPSVHCCPLNPTEHPIGHIPVNLSHGK